MKVAHKLANFIQRGPDIQLSLRPRL